MALGATRERVLAMVLMQSPSLIGAGILIGLPATLAATRLVANRLFGVGVTYPATMVAAVLLMTTLAALAGLLPARRASESTRWSPCAASEPVNEHPFTLNHELDIHRSHFNPEVQLRMT